MLFRIFTLHPEIFSSFFSTSLIARGLAKNVIQSELVDWREEFGTGNYKQVDEKPFGGGSGMVIQVDPIFKALQKFDAVSKLFKAPETPTEHAKIYPNNNKFFTLAKQQNIKKATISLTPRGFPLNQKTAEWLAENFEELNILCGRYEGFDERTAEAVDLEISLGDFVLNGGEVAAMALIESVSRLVPDFITKNTSVLHDSFSSGVNDYSEQKEFIIGKNRLAQIEKNNKDKEEFTDLLEDDLLEIKEENNLFNNNWWRSNILPKIEHPQYTRPEVWNNFSVPKVLLDGNHKLIQNWRENWYKNN